MNVAVSSVPSAMPEEEDPFLAEAWRYMDWCERHGFEPCERSFRIYHLEGLTNFSGDRMLRLVMTLRDIQRRP